MRQLSQYDLPSKISSPPKLEELDEIYETVHARITGLELWYNKHSELTRFGSVSARVFGVLAFLLGLLLPNISVEQGPNAVLLLKLGYLALLLGGLAILLDQVFLFSRSWSRYASASIATKAVIAQLEFDWLGFKCEAEANLTAQHGTSALKIFATATASARQIQLDETKLWKSDLEEGIKALRDKLRASDAFPSSENQPPVHP